MLVVASPPIAGRSGVLPVVRLHVAPLAGRGFGWVDDDLDDLMLRRHDFQLEDADDYGLGDDDVAYRRYAHRHGVHDLICERWAWEVPAAGCALTLEATCAREDYADFCDVFEEIAASCRPHALAA